jgi:hypothetical protein
MRLQRGGLGMKNQTAFILGMAAALSISLAVTHCNRDKPVQPTKISESAILYEMAVTERKQAERYLDSARQIKAARDTLYITRTRYITKWDSIIRQLPPSEILPARLDSCLEVGEIVLGELKACDSTVYLQGIAITHLTTANERLDSSRTELAQHLDYVNREVVKQRNAKRLAWLVAAVAVVVGMAF